MYIKCINAEVKLTNPASEKGYSKHTRCLGIKIGCYKWNYFIVWNFGIQCKSDNITCKAPNCKWIVFLSINSIPFHRNKITKLMKVYSDYIFIGTLYVVKVYKLRNMIYICFFSRREFQNRMHTNIIQFTPKTSF